MEEWRGGRVVGGRVGGWRVGCGWVCYIRTSTSARALVEGSPQQLYVASQRPQRLYVEPLTPGEVNFTWRKGGGFRFQFAALWPEDPPKPPSKRRVKTTLPGVPRGRPRPSWRTRGGSASGGATLPGTPGEVNFTGVSWGRF